MKSNTDCIIFPGRLPKHEIGFVNALLDDLEGMVVVRTVEAEEGRMEYWVAPDLVDEFMAFVDYVRTNLGISMIINDPIPHTTEFPDSLQNNQ